MLLPNEKGNDRKASHIVTDQINYCSSTNTKSRNQAVPPLRSG